MRKEEIGKEVSRWEKLFVCSMSFEEENNVAKAVCW